MTSHIDAILPLSLFCRQILKINPTVFLTGGQEIQSSTLELINGLVSLVLQSSMAEIADEVSRVGLC